MTTQPGQQAFDPYAYRSDFPILQRPIHDDKPLVYLDNAATTQRPRQVIQTLVEVYEEHFGNVRRGSHYLATKSAELVEQARAKTQAFIGAASCREIVFTSGTTASINLVARAWGDANLRRGDEILLTEMEHHSNLIPWQQLAARTGAALRFIPVRDDGLLELDALDELLTPRVKLAAVTAVSNVLGTMNPIGEIVRRVHQSGALVLVDGAQSVPHAATDVRAWDADFLAFSGHKMLGPTGIGVLYGKEEWLRAMPPFLGGGGMVAPDVTLNSFETADRYDADNLPAKFEAGTPPIAEIIGLGAAIDYLTAVGLQRTACHETALAQRAHEGLARIEGLRIVGPPVGQKAGIVTFAVADIVPEDLIEALDGRFGVAVRGGHHCAVPLHARLGLRGSTRASFYLYNTLEEVEFFIDALSEAVAWFRQRGHRGSGRRRVPTRTQDRA